MHLLVMGGTTFVGPAVVRAALDRGWEVTCVHRGRAGSPPEGVRSVVGDRTDPQVLAAVARGSYDVALDPWSGAPHVARDTARLLGRSVGRWAYVSSESVYAWPPPVGADEATPTVPADPDGAAGDYAADKRGAELAYEREVGADRVVLLRCGLILGPGEQVDRLPWWLRRFALGGDVLVPGPADVGLQYVDVRDLAEFALQCLVEGRSGPVNTVSEPAHATMADLVASCREVTGGAGTPVWVDGAWLTAEGVEPWTELPIWIPPQDEGYAMHSSDTRRAAAWGLRVRPLADTVADTWAWMASAPAYVPRSTVGLDPAREAGLLSAWRGRAARA